MTDTIKISVQNSQSQIHATNSDAGARTPPKGGHGEACATPRFMCTQQSRVDGAILDPGAEGSKMSRRRGRRFRREQKRKQKHEERCKELGGAKDVFTYNRLFKAGQDCCKGVRWKQSVQNFEAHLFSRTAVCMRQLKSGNYKFKPYSHFTLCERGKERPIDAPSIQDRQPEKVFTQDVLLPLYQTSMIYNNGASLPGKGFGFALKELKKDLVKHYRKYGREGGILLTDGKKFFPSADHNVIKARHEKLILNTELRDFADRVIDTIQGDVGLPLGVEPSQAEMVALPSALDNYMKCQMRMKGYGHYMDDFYVLIPPGVDWHEIFDAMKRKAAECGITLNRQKTRYVPLAKPFRFCKAKFIITETGKIITRANKKAMPRNRRKLKAFKELYDKGKMTAQDLWCAVNGMIAYLRRYNEYNHIKELCNLFHDLFGWSCWRYKEFMKGAEVCTTS